jgi:flagellar basal body-associated protein FliL
MNDTKEKNQMNKKVVTSIIVVIVLALLAAAIIYAPSLMETMMRLHGIR